MEQYEQETGKKAIWHGKITKGFEDWKNGKKDYYAGKKRISVYVSNETEKEWLDFIQKSNISSISKLIRNSVDYFIEEKSTFMSGDVASFSHNLKQRLTTIKGYLQLVLEKYGANLNDEIISIIDNVLNESKSLEESLIKKLEKPKIKTAKYDILLVEDDLSTVNLISNYFEVKGYSCKGVMTGLKAIEELNFNAPKLILLDIILPDISGYEICKEVKSNERFKNIPIIYITAVTVSDVEKHMEETKADGYILKPFDLTDFDFLYNYLS